MEHKKDIGNLLKDRLDNAQKTPQQTLWDRLDNSLNEREKKRRRAVWFWYGSAGILLAILLAGGILWTQNGKDFLNTSSDAEINTEETIFKNKPETKKETESSLKNNVGTQITIEHTTKIDSITTKQTNETKKTTSINGKNSKGKKSSEDGFTITTTHEYYNSDLDTTTTSQNKKQIDSLVAANKHMMAIKDSIARKRAQDSIKLNEARKDTIPE